LLLVYFAEDCESVDIYSKMYILLLVYFAEDWSDDLFGALKTAGGKAFSTYAVGYNNVNVPVTALPQLAFSDHVPHDTTHNMPYIIRVPQ
jgi:hypothetical protein